MSEVASPARVLDLPPLLNGRATPDDPFAVACAAAEEADPGTVFYGIEADTMRAAVLLAPEVPLAEAMGVTFAASLGVNDAIGALAPPEVAFHVVWPDRFRVNGALAGHLRAASGSDDPTSVPDWLVIGVEMRMSGAPVADPGRTPDVTTLFDEGCSDFTSADLTEAWGRHMMNWLHIYLTDGFAPLHEQWRTKAHGLGERVDYPEPGTFIGLDELGGMILKDDSGTRILPLTRLLERP